MRVVLFLAVSSKAQLDDVSIPEQRRAMTEVCEQRGWRIVDELVVPGHSRSKDVVTILTEYRRQKVDAYDKLNAHCKAEDFDQLFVYDHSRLARSMSLYAWCAEICIEAGAKIYFFHGGEITESDMDMQIALGGMQATAGIKRLVKMRNAAYDRKAAQGHALGNRAPFGYLIVRDESNGKPRTLTLDTSKERMLHDLADLFLSGVGYGTLAKSMVERGHEHRPVKFYYEFLFNPATWGNSARYWVKHSRFSTDSTWFMDDSDPPPVGVKVWYNTHEPLYTGELRLRMQQEIRRRQRENWYHNHNAAQTYPFSGIFICPECGYHLAHQPVKGYTYLRCVISQRRMRYKNPPPVADHSYYISLKVVERAMDAFLGRLKQTRNESELVAIFPTSTYFDERRSLLQEIADLEQQIRNLLARQSNDKLQSIQYLIEDELEKKGTQLAILRKRLDNAEVLDTSGELEARQDALNRLRRQDYYEMTNLEKNQFWTALLGPCKLVYRDEVITVVRKKSS